MKKPTGTGPTTGKQALDKKSLMLSRFFHESERYFNSYRWAVDRDYDYVDGDQLTEEEREILNSREQPPIVFNEIQSKVGAILGTEDGTKLDITYLARGANDAAKSQLYSAASKYVEDENGSPFEISRAFRQQTCGGLGIIYSGFNWNQEGPRVLEEQVDWRDIRFDPLGKKPDLSDFRFVIRKNWMDTEAAVAMFPDYEREIRESVGRPGYDSRDGRVMNMDEDQYTQRVWHDGDHVFGWRNDEWQDTGNDRVLICECYYRVFERRTLLRRHLTGEVGEIDMENPTAEQVVIMMEEPYELIENAPVQRVRLAIFAGPNILIDEPSPYAHNRFPFVFFWGQRKHRTGEHYGIVRNMIDPQDIVNLSFSKMLYALGTTQVWHEAGAVIDEDSLADNANDPAGQIGLNPGGLQKVRVERWENNAMMHKAIMEMAGVLLGENTGTTEAFMGQKSNETSGYAINLRQQASGITIIGNLFVNYREALKQLAEIRISNIRQTFTAPMFMRITDDPTAEAIIVNDLLYIPEADQYIPHNTITSGKVDVVVSAEPHAASIRQAFAEQLMQMISRLPDQAVIAMLDLPIMMSDPPQKDKILERIRMVQAQLGMNTEPMTGGGPGNNGGGSPPLARIGSQEQPRSAAAVA